MPIFCKAFNSFLLLPISTFGTSARSLDSTFGTNAVAMHTEVNPIVLSNTYGHNIIALSLL